MKILTDYRKWHYPDCSFGELHIDGKFFCYTLCDTIRGWGIKVPKHTAIPVTTDFFYKVDVTYSQRFKKELPIIYTEINKDGVYVLKNGGIEFTSIRAHGGNDSEDTEGCVLVGYGRDNNNIYNQAADDLTMVIKLFLKTDTVGLKVVNL